MVTVYQILVERRIAGCFFIFYANGKSRSIIESCDLYDSVGNSNNRITPMLCWH